ncbi:hypothetical protein VCUG_01959 [Vavraia culicis subsp. floridensis]|uniref:Uncharacterized protein n=1 Tax=Vavraia culicis (isolate floridensis) TaxID=948595 RepID=L2GS90_VAVCU|nr:uncharacterized protein VCUG_01959 [Vavraia culicis subsp. floridensis]ELA46526.1 hypothetical protein VCUG_01959 [Vavraia culicis subsp. floridensis]
MATKQPDIYDLAFQSDETEDLFDESEVEQLSQTDVDLYLAEQHDRMVISNAVYLVYSPPPELNDPEAEERRRKRRRERNRRYRQRKKNRKKAAASVSLRTNTSDVIKQANEYPK